MGRRRAIYGREDMTKLVYTGPHEAVVMADGTAFVNGTPRLVSEKTAKSLEGRSDFEVVTNNVEGEETK